MTKRSVVLFLLLCAIWLLWSGLTVKVPGLAALWGGEPDPGGAFIEVDPMLAGFGLGSSALVVWLVHRLDIADHEALPLHLTGRILAFIPWLAREVLSANLAVARIILSRRPRVRPVLVRVKASQRTVIGQVIHANTITLTPGTVTLDLRDGELLVHALDASLASDEDSRTIDARISRVEGNAPRSLP